MKRAERRGWWCLQAMLAVTAIGCHREAPPSVPAAEPKPMKGAEVDAARLANPAADDWVSTGRDARGTYFSPLSDINSSNVKTLGFAWDYKLGTNRGQESTPLVIDGVMYATSNLGRVYALEASNGKELWKFDPHVNGEWARYACCDTVNRGLAAFAGRLYVASLDGWLYSLDARTGEVVWKSDTVLGRQEHRPYTQTGVPLLAGDLIIIGGAGGDFARARGFVSAFDRTSGALKWRFFTVPHDPKDGPQEEKRLETALKTWDPRHPWAEGSGGTVWDGMAYDPGLNLVYVGTGNAAPYNMRRDGRHGGDELFAASIIAIHADSGAMAWYYQTTPGDRWDFDSTQKFVLADLELSGKPRTVIMQAAKNGFYYVLDRQSGELLSASNFAYASWAHGVDLKTGRPLVDAKADYDRAPALVFPSEAGAHSWQPMAYNPDLHVTYLPVIEAGNIMIEASQRPAGLVEGQFTTPALPPELYDPKALQSLYGSLPSIEKLKDGIKTNIASRGFVRAFSVTDHRVLWEAATATSWDGGVLATGGNLVVQGDANGNLVFYSADKGERLIAIPLGSSMMAAPMTYRVNGTQYIAIVAGYGGGGVILGSPLDPESAAYKYGNDGRIIALKLGGSTPVLPPVRTDSPISEPPPRSADKTQIAAGGILYNRFCSRCHVMGRGNLPDLRRLSPATHQIFDSIVLNGAYASKGMGNFSDVLSNQDAQAIHAWLIDQAWELKSAAAASGNSAPH